MVGKITLLTKVSTTRIAISLALLLLLTNLLPIKVFSIENGGYPWYQENMNKIDQWGYVMRNCTSFVAWKLSVTNDFSMPWGVGNAGYWGVWAEDNDYVVDMSPVVGSVAWWDFDSVPGLDLLLQ